MYLQEMRPEELMHAVTEGWPLLVPAGCIEYHGPHLPLGTDTFIAEELCRRLAQRMPVVIAPSLAYGATGYAVSGPEQGTMDVDNETFEAYVKSVLRAFCALGFRRIAVAIFHQGMEGPLALACKKAAAELAFEVGREEGGQGWWGRGPTPPEGDALGRIRVWPCILPEAGAVAHGDHAGMYETSYILAARPELVAMDRLTHESLPWFCTRPENPSRQGNAALGEAMFTAMVDAWERALRAWA